MMNSEAEKEEKLRESACTGDLDQLKKLIEHDNTNVNSQNTMNGWTALHWACKRNHVAAVKYLLSKGADKNVQNSSKEVPAQLTNTAEIRHILDYSGTANEATQLSITPSYLKHPVFPYLGERADEPNPVPDISTHAQYNPIAQNVRAGPVDPKELVLKARVAYSMERDFIEVEIDRNKLTYDTLLSLLTKELGVDKHMVHKIRKLPNTIVRKDKDVQRLVDYQEIELVLTNKAMSSMSRNYSDVSGTDGFQREQILY